MSKFKVGDLVRRKRGFGQNGEMPEGRTFVVTKLEDVCSDPGVVDVYGHWHAGRCLTAVSTVGTVTGRSSSTSPAFQELPKKGHHPVHTGLQQHSVGSIYPYILVGYGDDTWGICDNQGRQLRFSSSGRAVRATVPSNAIKLLAIAMAGSRHLTFESAAPVDNSVTLTITRDQAETLLQVCDNIAGAPDGPRGDMDAVRRQLTKAGVKQADHPLGCACAEGGYIQFL